MDNLISLKYNCLVRFSNNKPNQIFYSELKPVWIKKANFYDQKYRMIQSLSTLYPSGTGMVSNRFDFAGKVLESLEIQNVNSVENKIRYTHSYDPALGCFHTQDRFAENDMDFTIIYVIIILTIQQYNGCIGQ